MREIQTEGIEIVARRNAVNARARERARRARERQIERLIVILHRMVVIASVLMVLAGAGMIDSAATISTELSGALMMLGGFAVMVTAGMMNGTGEENE